MRVRAWLVALAMPIVAAGVGATLWYRANDQRPDATFDATVSTQSYPATHPRVQFDRAHHNFHTSSGRYAPLAKLLANDGYTIGENARPFDEAHAFDSTDVLIVANAMGWWIPRGQRAARPAFRPEEIAAVRAWVRQGGSLLLVADHYPAGEAARDLSAAFGVNMRGGWLADERNEEPSVGSPTWIRYSSQHGLGDHPIIAGRSPAEQIHLVVAFTGQSLSVPVSAVALLQCDSTAVDIMPAGRQLPAHGRAQGVALSFGRGRLVVVGEAAMLTAQVTGGGRLRFGMNWPHTDDKQFALNVLHWLSHLI